MVLFCTVSDLFVCLVAFIWVCLLFYFQFHDPSHHDNTSIWSLSDGDSSLLGSSFHSDSFYSNNSITSSECVHSTPEKENSDYHVTASIEDITSSDESGFEDDLVVRDSQMRNYLELGSSFTQRLSGNVSVCEELHCGEDLSESACEERYEDRSQSPTWGKCFSILDQDSLCLPYQADTDAHRRRSAEFLIGRSTVPTIPEVSMETKRTLTRRATFCVRSKSSVGNLQKFQTGFQAIDTDMCTDVRQEVSDVSLTSDVRQETSDVSLISDQSSFMHRPMCYMGVTEQDSHMSSKKKKSLIKKLRSVGQQLQEKCSGVQRKHLRTLAVL